MKSFKMLSVVFCFILFFSSTVFAEGGIPGKELLIDECKIEAGYYISVDPNYLTAASLWGLSGQFAQLQRMISEGKIEEVEEEKEVSVLRCDAPKYTFVGNIPIRIGPYCRVSIDENPNKSPVWIYVKGIDCGKRDNELPKDDKEFIEEDKSHGI